MTRRNFLRTTALLAATNGLAIKTAHAAKASGRSPKRPAFIDTNVTLSRWPFRRLPSDETGNLAAKLRHFAVTQAWAGSFDGLLHKDIAAVNARLTEECHKHGRDLFMPFGSINLNLPDWEEDLRLCQETHEMPGIRLHPNYHRYKLDAPVFAKLLSLAAERSLIVQLAIRMEDERTQNLLAPVPPVDAAPLVDLLKEAPKARLVLLNWAGAVKPDLAKRLSATGQVFFDIATLENVGGVASLFQQVRPDRVLFGSHAPFFYFESAELKLKESALTPQQQDAIRGANATRLLRGET
jgi:predicted TIM-barrel fold metal-dependent hydrolase